MKTDKNTRILLLYDKLMKGEAVQKQSFISENSVTARSFDRDIEDIRLFLSEYIPEAELRYDHKQGGYTLSSQTVTPLKSNEYLAILKVLVGCRCLCRGELLSLVESLLQFVPSNEQKSLYVLIQNELDEYHGPNHHQALLNRIGELGKCISSRQILNIQYRKKEGETVSRRISPIGILFSEYYFYLVAFIGDKEYTAPAFFRVDRIASVNVSNEIYPYSLLSAYNVAYTNARLQFMFAGKQKTVELLAEGFAMEAILDRLPVSRVESLENGKYRIVAEVHDKGFIHWVLSQGTHIQILGPPEVRDQVTEHCKAILQQYSENE